LIADVYFFYNGEERFPAMCRLIVNAVAKPRPAPLELAELVVRRLRKRKNQASATLEISGYSIYLTGTGIWSLVEGSCRENDPVAFGSDSFHSEEPVGERLYADSGACRNAIGFQVMQLIEYNWYRLMGRPARRRLNEVSDNKSARVIAGVGSAARTCTGTNFDGRLVRSEERVQSRR